MKRIIVMLMALAVIVVAVPAIAADVDESFPKEELALINNMVKVDGRDVLVHPEIVEAIRNFNPAEPVYALNWTAPDPYDPENLPKYVMSKEADGWYRAKGMAGKRFHPAQMATGERNARNIRFARIEAVAPITGGLVKWVDMTRNSPAIKLGTRQ